MKKFSMMLVLITIVSMLTISCARRGGIIVGKIIDENSDPVVGAQIVTDPPSFSKLSSVDGYQMKGVKPGIYTITATKTGYSKQEVEIRVQNKRTTQADVQLRKLNR
jgi:iron complex outermembrane receptor protein